VGPLSAPELSFLAPACDPVLGGGPAL